LINHAETKPSINTSAGPGYVRQSRDMSEQFLLWFIAANGLQGEVGKILWTRCVKNTMTARSRRGFQTTWASLASQIDPQRHGESRPAGHSGT
jgi:hypothetical protein